VSERWAVEAVGLGKTYGESIALSGIDLRVGRGERVALLGANGAGKTTLLRTLALLLKPTSGEVRLAGYRADPRAGELRRLVGYLGHQSALYPDLTVEENLAFYASLYQIAAPGERIERLLASLDLTERRRQRVRALSRGNQQRAALARTLLHDPPVLLLDEPDTGLDVVGRSLLGELLGEPGRTVLLSTHNLDEGRRLGRRALVLGAGRLLFDGPVATLDESWLARAGGGR
jgi:heme exporter protein A